MPFTSQKQRAERWYLKSKGQNGSWDCAEWEEHMPSKLPDKVEKVAAEALRLLFKQAPCWVMAALA